MADALRAEAGSSDGVVVALGADTPSRALDAAMAALAPALTGG